MSYIESITEFIREFAYKEQAVYLLIGIISGYLLKTIVSGLQSRHLQRRPKKRNPVVIMPRSRQKAKGYDNETYFKYVKSAQYKQGE